MVHAGLSRTRWYVLSALIATLSSFAYAKGPFVQHGASGFNGGSYSGSYAYPRANIARPMPVAVSHHAHYTHNDARSNVGDQRMRAASSGRVADTGRVYTGNASGYTVQRMDIPGDLYRGRPSAQFPGIQYAGAITPVSTDSHTAPRPPANAQSAHVGSIRDDVARYNEERGASRTIPRPPGDSRVPAPSPYRN